METGAIDINENVGIASIPALPNSLGDYDVGHDVILLDGTLCRLEEYAGNVDGVHHFMISKWLCIRAREALAEGAHPITPPWLRVVELDTRSDDSLPPIVVSEANICCEVTVRCPSGRCTLPTRSRTLVRKKHPPSEPHDFNRPLESASPDVEAYRPNICVPQPIHTGLTRWHYVEPYYGCWLCLLTTRPTAFMYVGQRSPEEKIKNISVTTETSSLELPSTRSSEERILELALGYIERHHASCRYSKAETHSVKESLVRFPTPLSSVAMAVKRPRTMRLPASQPGIASDAVHAASAPSPSGGSPIGVASLISETHFLTELSQLRVLLLRDAYRREVSWRRDLEEMYQRFSHQVAAVHTCSNNPTQHNEADALHNSFTPMTTPMMCPSVKYGKGTALGLLHRRRFGKCLRSLMVDYEDL